MPQAPFFSPAHPTSLPGAEAGCGKVFQGSPQRMSGPLRLRAPGLTARAPASQWPDLQVGLWGESSCPAGTPPAGPGPFTRSGQRHLCGVPEGAAPAPTRLRGHRHSVTLRCARLGCGRLQFAFRRVRRVGRKGVQPPAGGRLLARPLAAACLVYRAGWVGRAALILVRDPRMFPARLLGAWGNLRQGVSPGRWDRSCAPSSLGPAPRAVRGWGESLLRGLGNRPSTGRQASPRGSSQPTSDLRETGAKAPACWDSTLPRRAWTPAGSWRGAGRPASGARRARVWGPGASRAG